MNRQSLFLSILGTTMVLALSACTSLTPVYGDRANGVVDSVRFNFSPPDSRLEQIVLNRLEAAFPGTASPNDPVLDIAVSSSTPVGALSDAFSVGRPTNVRVEATITISRGGAALFEATRFADAAYQGGKLALGNLEAKAGAEEAAARSVAESLRATILLGTKH